MSQTELKTDQRHVKDWKKLLSLLICAMVTATLETLGVSEHTFTSGTVKRAETWKEKLTCCTIKTLHLQSAQGMQGPPDGGAREGVATVPAEPMSWCHRQPEPTWAGVLPPAVIWNLNQSLPSQQLSAQNTSACFSEGGREGRGMELGWN